MISIASLAAAVSCGSKKEDAAAMASRLLADKGITVPFHPSTDFAELMRQYKANPELWDSAFECLSKTAPVLSGVTEFGTTELVGKKCYAVFSEYIPKPFEETKLEGHHDYIDIQLTEGPVKWGVCPSDSPKLKVLSEYDPSIIEAHEQEHRVLVLETVNLLERCAPSMTGHLRNSSSR